MYVSAKGAVSQIDVVVRREALNVLPSVISIAWHAKTKYELCYYLWLSSTDALCVIFLWLLVYYYISSNTLYVLLLCLNKFELFDVSHLVLIVHSKWSE